MGRIIIVEDNLTFSGYVCRLLESKGFQTVSTSTCNGHANCSPRCVRTTSCSPNCV